MTVPPPPLTPREPLLRALIDICGPDFVRHARGADAVAGRRPSFVTAPATTESVADTLRLAAARGLAVMPRGSGSKIGWGAPPPGVDLVLETGRINGLWDHRPEEFVAEVAAGTSVTALQAALALRGQRLAVDPPSPTATVGGMLAMNESGPSRQRWGVVAEQVNRISYVDADGEPGESDGENGRPGIADITGVITSASLRLQALPEARRWVGVSVSTPMQGARLVDDVLALGITPSAIELDLPAPSDDREPSGSLVTLLEGTVDEVDAGARVLDGAMGATVSTTRPSWWGRYPFRAGEVALRISVAIRHLPAAVFALSDATGGQVPIRGSAGLGSMYAVLPGSLPPERVEAVVESVGDVLMGRGGRAYIVAAPPEIAGAVTMATRRDFF